MDRRRKRIGTEEGTSRGSGCGGHQTSNKDYLRSDQYLKDEECCIEQGVGLCDTGRHPHGAGQDGRGGEPVSVAATRKRNIRSIGCRCARIWRNCEKRGDYRRAYAMRLRHDEISDSLVKANDSQHAAMAATVRRGAAGEGVLPPSWMLGLIIALAVLVALSIAVGTVVAPQGRCEG